MVLIWLAIIQSKIIIGLRKDGARNTTELVNPLSLLMIAKFQFGNTARHFGNGNMENRFSPSSLRYARNENGSYCVSTDLA
jgi:hypothetical protein